MTPAEKRARMTKKAKIGVDDTMEQESEVDNNVASLTCRIRDAYESGETDGILELANATTSLRDYSPQEILESSVEAANNNKRWAAGMINAWIGACFDRDDGAELAQELLQAYDDVADEIEMYPDIVTLSLVYSIFCQEDAYHEVAQSVLERAQRMSKKIGGSKRRKELAAARRRGPAVRAKDIERKLQILYGPEFQVLQETDDFVVLSKPSGVVCYHKHKTSVGKAYAGTRGRNDKKVDVSLVDALLQQNVSLSTLNAEGRGLVHRIDRGTSGCIVLAKTDDMHAKLLSLLFLRRAKKGYTAIVSTPTHATMEPEGEIAIPVDGRPAKSLYSVLERYENGTAKLWIETLTGRKHQVRVHCAKGLCAPILLDPIYADSTEEDAVDGRFLLHASSLCIPDYEINVQAPAS